MKSPFQRFVSWSTPPRIGLLLLLFLAGAWSFPTLRDVLLPQTTEATETQSSAPHPPLASGPEKFSFTSMGGVQISALLHQAQSKQAPLILLVHGLRGGMKRWEPALTQWAGESDITWVQVELRDTAFNKPGTAESAPLGEESWAGPLADVRGTLATLRTRFNITPSGIGILGEDLGGSLAVLFAAEDNNISALAVLHPGLEYRKWNIRPAARSLGERPALYVATAEDGYSRHSAMALAELSPNGKARIVNAFSAHGAALLKKSPAMTTELLQWFQRTLKHTSTSPGGSSQSPPSAVTAPPSTP